MKHLREVLMIKEAPALFTDAVLWDEAGTLLFLSLWGFDTAIKEFMARLSLPSSQGGINHFNVIKRGAKNRLISLGNIDHLEKLSGKTTDFTLFGNLSHLWLYDSLCLRSDPVNSRALMLYFSGEDEKWIMNRFWNLVKTLCHLPLLDHWQPSVIALLREKQLIKDCHGEGINGLQLHLDQEVLEASVTSLIQRGSLCLDEHPKDAPSNDNNYIADYFDNNVIHVYSRADAIADGTLVDVSEHAAEVGFRYPVALTRAVWEDCVAWDKADTAKQTYQDEEGRLHDVLWMSALRARAAKTTSESTVFFTVYRVPRNGRSRKPVEVQLKSVVSGGDSGEPVITIMEPQES